MILSPTPAFRDSILRQDEIYRQADVRWELKHGPITGGAKLLPFPKRRQLITDSVVDDGGAIGC